MNKKRGLVVLILFVFIFTFVLIIDYVTGFPPSPPNITLSPPAYCTLTNGGVEICDNIDNDCDNIVDDGLNTSVGCNQEGYCFGSYKVCAAGNWSVCSKLPGQETCNAVDDDCNGFLNNGLPNREINTSCTVSGTYGVCLAGLRYQYCNDSVIEYTWTMCSSYILPSSEKCNNMDDDCDNNVDENLTNTTGCNQLGYCNGSYKTCTSGIWSSTCSKVPSTEVCNNADDNCNGQTDENLTNTSGCNQLGYCEGSFKTCVSGGWPGVCSKVPISETCNNIDDNCNNLVDDGVTRPTTCGVGICANNTGVQICSLGNWTTNTCNPYSGATAEVCEGSKDENCNGVVDENCSCTLGSIRTCGDNNIGECRFGNQTCTGGVWDSVCLGVVNPQLEVCDGLDNDCDNSTDENLTDSSNCTQVGICAGSFRTCSGGNWSVCSIMPALETCNNLDDDCNGIPDDGLTNLSDCNQVGYCAGSFRTCSAGNWSSCSKVPIEETCNDIDDNCDGVADENDVCYVPPVNTNPSAGGGGGGGGSRPSTTTTTTPNTTKTTNITMVPIVNNTSVPEKVVEPIVNNSLVEILPIADKIENLSKSETNEKIHRTLMGYDLTNVIIVGAILMAMVVFISVFILDYSRKRQRMKEEKILRGVRDSGVVQDKKKETDYSNLSPQETQVLKYIEGMRQRGYGDDYTMSQLKAKGWKDEVLHKLFQR